MRKRLSESSLRGRRVLFSAKRARSPRQCGKHPHNSLIVRAYQLVIRIVNMRCSARWSVAALGHSGSSSMSKAISNAARNCVSFAGDSAPT
jgi:hypothetical protein